MDGGIISGPVTGATIGSVLNTTLRLSQVIYEFKAVEEQARDLLNSTKHVSSNVQIAKELRRKKSVHLDMTEKRWIDGVLSNTEKTLDNVKALIEPARVDMQTKFGSVGILNRSLFVFRDSPKVQTNLARLTLASSSLDQVLGVLCAREGHQASAPLPRSDNVEWRNVARLARRSTASLRSDFSSPPSYQSLGQDSRLEQNTTFESRRQTYNTIVRLPEDIPELEASSEWSEEPPPRADTRKEEVLISESWSLSRVPPVLEFDDGITVKISSSTAEPAAASQPGSLSPRVISRKPISTIQASTTNLEQNTNNFNAMDAAPHSRLSGRQRQRAFLAYQSSR